MITQPEKTERQVLSVSQLNRSAKNLLETYLPLLWVEGEISNFARPSSGHWYFSLKDQKAQVRCAMFRNRNLQVAKPPQNGDKVLLRARVSLYEGRGEFQLIVEHLEPAGLGALQAKFEALKNQLAEQGLFDQARKRPLPRWPQAIGVVTSPTGAAIHDILHVLKRRAPSVAVNLIPVAVQGAAAASEIVKAIELANRHRVCDVLIVGRGGGSLEDLWAFNEEPVARAIFASEIPVISAVGHEVDFSIADFVADQRAPTPSAAAELAVADSAEILARLTGLERQLTLRIRQHLLQAATRLQSTRRLLRHPGEQLQQQAQRLDSLELQLKRSINQSLRNTQQQLFHTQQRLLRANPGLKLPAYQQRLAQLSARMEKLIQSSLALKQQKLTHSASLLGSVSPLNTLQRGYAIVYDHAGKPLRSVGKANRGDGIKAQLHDGELICTVEQVSANSDS